MALIKIIQASGLYLVILFVFGEVKSDEINLYIIN
jgi:hypothetical protein